MKSHIVGLIGRLSVGVGSALCAVSLSCHGADFVDFRPDLPGGALCRVEIALLHPTQSAVGREEVRLRAEKVRRLSPKKLERYLREKVAPIVVGPGDAVYLLDHHHLACVLLESGVSRTIYAQVKENWRARSETEFWTQMAARNWVCLYDESGQGPLSPGQLPKSLVELRDDPYRSLAWLVRQSKGFRETDVLFADFLWAAFFRSRVTIDPGPGGFDRAVEMALKLSRSVDAKDLPGYVEP